MGKSKKRKISALKKKKIDIAFQKQELIKYFKENNLFYNEINNEEIEIFYKLFLKKDETIIFSNNNLLKENPLYLYYIGKYYEKENNIEEMLKYYDIASEKGDLISINICIIIGFFS